MNRRMEQEMERTIVLLYEYMPAPEREAEASKSTNSAARGRSSGRSGIRRTATVAFAVILVLCAAGFAYAVFTDGWFGTYFAERAGRDLTPSQYRFIEEKSVGIGQSVTAEGYTVTVDSAICDANNLFVVIKIEGPEDVKLDMDPAEGNCFFDHARYESRGSYERTGHTESFSRGWIHLDDGDSKENTVSLLMNDQRSLSADSNQVYTDGEIWNLQLADLSTRTGEYFSEKTVLAKGGWSFSFPLSEMSGEIELISSPVMCFAVETGTDNRYDIYVTSLTLSPFGATCRYEYAPGSRPEAIDMLDIYLIMDDGNTVPASWVSGGGAGAIGSNSGTMNYRFEAPLILEEAACLVLPDNVKIPIPE